MNIYYFLIRIACILFGVLTFGVILSIGLIVIGFLMVLAGKV